MVDLYDKKIGIPFTNKSLTFNVPMPPAWLKWANQTEGEIAVSAINQGIKDVLVQQGYTLASSDTTVLAKKAGVNTASEITIPQATLWQDSGTGFWCINPERWFGFQLFVHRGQRAQCYGGVTPLAIAYADEPDELNPVIIVMGIGTMAIGSSFIIG